MGPLIRTLPSTCCILRGPGHPGHRTGRTFWGLGVVHILVEASGVSTGTHIPSLPQGMLQACSTKTGREAGWPTSPPQLQARHVISSPNEVPWGPSHNWISGSKGIHLDISKYPQGLVLASDPHRHPLVGATHQATVHSCLASSGILCTFFKPR